MIALRHAHPALRRGSYESLFARKDVHVHLRQHDGDSVVVALNASRQTRRVDIPVRDHLADGAVLPEVWSSGSARVESGTIHHLELAPRSGRVFATPTAST